MYLKKFLLVSLICGLLTACNEAGKSNDASQKTDSSLIAGSQSETREAMLYHQTMDIHNEVMAKMGKLNGYKKKVQQQTDSIKSMLATTDFTRQMAQRIAEDLDSLNVVGKGLQVADSAMNSWMEQFNPDPKMPTSDARADYFEKQKASAELMKVTFFEALRKAENLFSSSK